MVKEAIDRSIYSPDVCAVVVASRNASLYLQNEDECEMREEMRRSE